MTGITIEEMTTMSYILLIVAILLGIVAVILFFKLKIPKAYRSVKGHGRNKRRDTGKKKSNSSLKTLNLKEGWQQEDKTEILHQPEVSFAMLQDITFVHTEEEL